ncbi:uncharacterized protein A4U43_C04F34880 [Asparagus officinalis]|uniref:Uncharacterized protein n=1 Tax=Asparagus officinalis TaxID=4686 RepID=A0A5P1FAT5_ASPOF|nr:uncharacterized protein A4U43_C04F34880 [Asparagus officinalis]
MERPAPTATMTTKTKQQEQELIKFNFKIASDLDWRTGSREGGIRGRRLDLLVEEELVAGGGGVDLVAARERSDLRSAAWGNGARGCKGLRDLRGGGGGIERSERGRRRD